MDLMQAASKYVLRMIDQPQKASAPARMRVLLLDSETLAFISAVASQKTLLAQEVYVVDRLENNNREVMRSLDCICFVRPTHANIQTLVRELREPKYSSYNLYFSNVVMKSSLRLLAESDDLEVVKSVREAFNDYLVVNPDLFSLSPSTTISTTYGPGPNEWSGDALSRCSEGIFAVLASLKKRPSIRYLRTSALASRLADGMREMIEKESSVLDFRQSDTPPVLLIVDRRDDLITPLLTQWTYQAMTHELVGIDNGKVTLKGLPKIPRDMQEITLLQDQDPFFKTNMYFNFGDLGMNVKEYVEQFSSKTNSRASFNSLSDLKTFIDNYPEFRKQSSNVTKHVTLVSELSRRVQQDELLEVSELEQRLACSDSHGSDLKILQEIIRSPKIKARNKTRLVAIYTLRHLEHPNNATPVLLDLLRLAGNISQEEIDLVYYIITYQNSLKGQIRPKGQAGQSGNAFADIFQAKSFFAEARERFLAQGVENVFTQHVPPLENTIRDLVKGKLPEDKYAVIAGSASAKAQDIIVFVIGGATYEEARSIAKLNGHSVQGKQQLSEGGGSKSDGGALPGVRVVLGAPTIHNSSSFITEVEAIVRRWPPEMLARSKEALMAGRKR